jgi:hypothetical protein
VRLDVIETREKEGVVLVLDRALLPWGEHDFASASQGKSIHYTLGVKCTVTVLPELPRSDRFKVSKLRASGSQ